MAVCLFWEWWSLVTYYSEGLGMEGFLLTGLGMWWKKVKMFFYKKLMFGE